MSQSTTINISTQTIVKILVIVLGLYFIRAIRDVLIVVFVALVLSAAIDPTISRLERRGVPRGLGIALIYVGLIGLIGLLIVLFVPLVTSQLNQFSNSLPELFQKATSFFQGNQDTSALAPFQKALDTIAGSMTKLTQGFFSGVLNFFGGLFSFIAVMVLTFYLTLEEKGMKRVAVDIAPAKYRPYLTRLFNRIEERLGYWLRGQLTLGLIIATLSYIGLFFLHIKFALVLALIAGLTELIPMVGPYIGMIPAIIVAVSQAPIMGLWVALMYYGIQQLENNLIVPRVIGRATGLNPIIVIISLLVGAKIAGITGIILAVPTVIIVTTFLEDFLEEKKSEDLKLESGSA